MISPSLLRIFPSAPAQHALANAWPALRQTGWSQSTLKTYLLHLRESPENYRQDPILGDLARLLLQERVCYLEPEGLEPWPDRSPGRRGLPEARRLPISVHGAVLPGRQAGWGLPVGGVLATRDSVIPRAVGRDVGCRVHLSIFPEASVGIERPAGRSRVRRTAGPWIRFGLDGCLSNPGGDPIFDDPGWSRLPLLSRYRERTRQRFGSSGTGNHFVDFGVVRVEGGVVPDKPEGGRFLALLSHHGSRGLGEAITAHFHQQARRQRGDLPRELRDWAWLELDSCEGQDYWAAMELCLRTTEASHRWLHANLARELELGPSWSHSSPHNFASREIWRGQKVVVHRKGAIRLGPEEFGVICGSQTAPTLLVHGTDSDEALHSASHGLGREMSRGTARRAYRRRHTEELYRQADVEVVNHQPDEWPGTYRVQSDSVAGHAGLITSVGAFEPRLVWMCGLNESSED